MKNKIRENIIAMSELQKETTKIIGEIDSVTSKIKECRESVVGIEMGKIEFEDLQEFGAQQNGLLRNVVRMFENIDQNLFNTFSIAEEVLHEYSDKELWGILILRVIEHFKWEDIQKMLGDDPKALYDSFMEGITK